MAATACTILVLLNSTAFSANMLVFRIEIIGMTGGAEGRVLRVGPAEHRVDAVTVTAAATQIPSVVTRIVTLRVVTEAGRRPSGCYMAGVALERRVYVAQRLACRIAAVDVTLVTVTGAAGIMNPGATNEGGGSVAGRAIQAGTQMRRIGLRVHADSRDPVMAAGTIVHDTGVIEGRREETADIVTDAAILACRYMIERLADSKRIVVTGSAVVHDANMTEGGRYEAGGYMTLAAITGSRYMVGRRHFARCGNAIVTRGAVAGNTCMIKLRTRKGGGVMAQDAILRGAQMIQWLDGCDGSGSVMA